MNGPLMFARITKVDEKTRTVTGRACQEYPDLSGEILDYASSKPHFKTWIKETKSASAGKSLGNVRAMHGNVAAGKLVGVEFNDTERAFDVAAKIVDKDEMEKVLEGVYTGFSIGGNYVGAKWDDPERAGLKRYTAAPIELSLVDKPCIPTATFFDIFKADGTTVTKAFKPLEATADASKQKETKEEGSEGGEKQKVAEKEEEKLSKGGKPEDDEEEEEEGEEDALEVKGSPEDVASFAKLLNTNGLKVSQAVSIVEAALERDFAKIFAPLAEKATFADPANKRFPIDTEAQVKAAWYYANLPEVAEKYADGLDAVKQRIVEAWKAQIDETGPVEEKDAGKLAKASADAFMKNFWTASSLCNVLDSIKSLVTNIEFEYTLAGRPEVAARLKLSGGSFAQAVVDYLQACVEDFKAADKSFGYSAEATLKKAQETAAACVFTKEELEKYGSRNNKPDMERIQKVHDMSVELSARCSKKNPAGFWDEEEEEEEALEEEGASDKMAKAADFQKLLDKVTKPLLDRISKLEAQPAAPMVRLYAITKGVDSSQVGGDEVNKDTRVVPVMDSKGQPDEVATLIKGVHKSGGVSPFGTVKKV